MEDQLGIPDWPAIWSACARRIRGWPVPSHWSAADWREEVRALAAAEAWQALCDFDRGRGLPLGQFVRHRVLARVLARHRQEWAYGQRCRPGPASALEGRRPDGATPAERDPLALRDLLDGLSSADRGLLVSLYWDGRTEAEVAERMGISQPAVNKRKRAALRALGTKIVPEIREISGCGYKAGGSAQYSS
jgi:DNA-directed RNA polymerase specialized sigma24 family protein